MRLTPKQRERIRRMFGGRCAYCGCELDEKWHVDHVEPIRRETVFVYGEITKAGYSKTKPTGKCYAPHNERKDNLFPSCVRCNILKADANVEGFRGMLGYFAKSIPTIRTYSHVHHLMRFNRLSISNEPVVFWFEQHQSAEPTPSSAQTEEKQCQK